nr:MAG TPA: hypothetical protein [Caudoviricetes sp.]
MYTAWQSLTVDTRGHATRGVIVVQIHNRVIPINRTRATIRTVIPVPAKVGRIAL